MLIKSQLSFQFADKNRAEWFHSAMIPEMNAYPMTRAKWQLQISEQDSACVVISVEAGDIIAYRATVNSLTRLAYLAEVVTAL